MGHTWTWQLAISNRFWGMVARRDTILVSVNTIGYVDRLPLILLFGPEYLRKWFPEYINGSFLDIKQGQIFIMK